jgi:hypothetical protein
MFRRSDPIVFQMGLNRVGDAAGRPVVIAWCRHGERLEPRVKDDDPGYRNCNMFRRGSRGKNR